jgi:hypothetical protein
LPCRAGPPAILSPPPSLLSPSSAAAWPSPPVPRARSPSPATAEQPRRRLMRSCQEEADRALLIRPDPTSRPASRAPGRQEPDCSAAPLQPAPDRARKSSRAARRPATIHHRFNGAVTLSLITPSHQWGLEPTVSPSPWLSLPLPSYKAEAAPMELSLLQPSLPPSLSLTLLAVRAIAGARAHRPCPPAGVPSA